MKNDFISKFLGARNAHAMVYVSSQNSLYLFGGLGFATTGDYGINYYNKNWSIIDFLNDMWRFNLTSAIWTFLGGNTDSTFDASYGILNVENPTNIPGKPIFTILISLSIILIRVGGRWSHSMVYVESKNALYLFGGFGYDSAYNQG